MNPIPSSPAARAVTLLEVVVVVAVVAMLAAMLAAAAAESRRHASLTQNLANLQQFAAGTTTYAADWEDRVWSFTDGPASTGAPGPGYWQGAWIIRSQLDGRPDIDLPTSVYWPYYSHLVLLYHLESQLLSPWAVSPEDHTRQAWQRDPTFSDIPDDQRPLGTNIEIYAYSSSYELGAAFTAPNAIDGALTTADQHGLPHNRWYLPDVASGNRFLHEVSFPSQKAMVYERQQRHFGARNVYFMHDEARIPVLTADGAAAVRRTADANSGFRPNSPASPAPTLIRYEPNGLWEAPTMSGWPSETLSGHYRWTRGGLKGRDFDAPEIDTSTW